MEQIDWEESPEVRVARGVARLDEVYGPGWREWIDTDSLNMMSGADCIAGQIGRYRTDGAEEWREECEHLITSDTESIEVFSHRYGFLTVRGSMFDPEYMITDVDATRSLAVLWLHHLT